MALTHDRIERSPLLLAVLILVVVAIAGTIEIIPLSYSPAIVEPVAGLKPYTALTLTGRDIYIREGCGNCHSQMVRPLRAEVERYGHYSVAGEFVYDRPFLWGSKRTGPDLHRVGGRYSDEWHRQHLADPRSLVPESNMPGYPWLARTPADGEGIEAKLSALRRLGVPYSDEDIAGARGALAGRSEMDALIAYLQGLGTLVKRQ
jgi:cytochrome c oxidase cbb3-type subunit 2